MNNTMKAEIYAFGKHLYQRRKYTNELYFTHLYNVAEIVRQVPHISDMIAAAFLHDVVEDTDATMDDIRRIFNWNIATLVEMLTDVSRPADGNRKRRKRIDLLHTKIANPDAKTIKLADLIDNSKSIIIFDPKFAKVYMAEKKLLLEVLKEGDNTLWKEAKQIVDNYYKENKGE